MALPGRLRRSSPACSIRRPWNRPAGPLRALDGRPRSRRRPRFDAVVTLHNMGSFGLKWPGPGATAPLPLQPAAGHRPSVVMIPGPPSTGAVAHHPFCMKVDIVDCYIAVESKKDLRVVSGEGARQAGESSLQRSSQVLRFLAGLRCCLLALGRTPSPLPQTGPSGPISTERVSGSVPGKCSDAHVPTCVA